MEDISLSYKIFINQIPKETKELIFLSIKIYKKLENIEFDCTSYSHWGKESKTRLSKKDKACGSIFLAGLIVYSEGKRRMNEHGIFYRDAIKYFGINKLSLENSCSEDEYEEYYNNIFKELIDTIGDCNGIESNFDFTPELLIYPLASSLVGESNIVSWIYRERGWHDKLPVTGFEHPSFLSINEYIIKFKNKKNNIVDINNLIKNTMNSVEKIIEKDENGNIIKKYKNKYGKIGIIGFDEKQSIDNNSEELKGKGKILEFPKKIRQ